MIIVNSNIFYLYPIRFHYFKSLYILQFHFQNVFSDDLYLHIMKCVLEYNSFI